MANIDPTLILQLFTLLPALPPKRSRRKKGAPVSLLSEVVQGVLASLLSNFLPAPLPALLASLLLACWARWIWPALRRRLEPELRRLLARLLPTAKRSALPPAGR